MGIYGIFLNLFTNKLDLEREDYFKVTKITMEGNYVYFCDVNTSIAESYMKDIYLNY